MVAGACWPDLHLVGICACALENCNVPRASHLHGFRLDPRGSYLSLPNLSDPMSISRFHTQFNP